MGLSLSVFHRMSRIWPQKLPRVNPLTPHRSPLQDFPSPTEPQILSTQKPSLAFSRASGLPFPPFALPLSTFETKPNNFSRTLLAAPDTFLGLQDSHVSGRWKYSTGQTPALGHRRQSPCKTTTEKPKNPKKLPKKQKKNHPKGVAWPIYLSAFEA